MGKRYRNYRIVALPGEGIGVEVVEAALRVLERVAQLQGFSVQVDRALIGQPAFAAYGHPLPEATLQQCGEADGILFGAVAQGGLLELRKRLDLFANLRPVRSIPCLRHCSSLKPEKLDGVDILFVRELVSGIYFGPAGRSGDERGAYGYHTMQYHDWEMRRIAQVALQQAQQRRHLLTVAHKENALPYLPWRQCVAQEAVAFPEVVIEPMLVDNLAMQLVRQPQHFDVILAGNLFGDMLSDIGGALVGSIGLLGSASLSSQGLGLYEPVHGTAPDIAGRGIANPLGMINSVVLMLQQWNETAAANCMLQAQERLLTQGYRTADLLSHPTDRLVDTQTCTDLLLAALEQP